MGCLGAPAVRRSICVVGSVLVLKNPAVEGWAIQWRFEVSDACPMVRYSAWK
jgi:hypothetical protein